MSVLIKGMEMPAKGEYELRLFCHSDGTATLEGFPIEFESEPFEVIEIPTPHGRLIDGVKLLKTIADNAYLVKHGYNEIEYGMTCFGIMQAISEQPAIIEAEEGNLSTAFQSLSKTEKVEVVRCKDCRWGREVCGNIECFVDSNIPPEYHGYEWFCPNGERRENDSEAEEADHASL